MTCGEEHCITCSDAATPMRVSEVRAGGEATCIDESDASHMVITDLVAPVLPGDSVLVHAGVAIGRL